MCLYKHDIFYQLSFFSGFFKGGSFTPKLNFIITFPKSYFIQFFYFYLITLYFLFLKQKTLFSSGVILNFLDIRYQLLYFYYFVDYICVPFTSIISKFIQSPIFFKIKNFRSIKFSSDGNLLILYKGISDILLIFSEVIIKS